jgi:hypothetical protein
VFTAPQVRADSSNSSINSTAINLCGTVKFTPMNRIAAAPARAGFKSPGGRSKARYRQSNPNALMPALCIAGDAE